MVATTTTAGPAVPAGPAAGAPRRRGGSRWRLRLEILLMAGPALLVYVSFVLLPVVLAAFYSFYNWNGLGPLEQFIGLENYRRALSDPVFLGAVRNNAFLIVASLVVQGPMAIGIALLLNRPLRGRAVLRVLIFVPYVLSEVIAGLAWRLLLQPQGGFDALLAALGLSGVRQLWLADTDFVIFTVFAILCWKYLGFAVILFLAGLQGIPEELTEAAQIDGAGWWTTQRYITVPLLGPTIRIWVFLSVIGSLQLFDLVWITTGGGPANSTATMATYMVQYGFQRSQLGFGSAVAVLLFAISLVFAIIYQRLVLRRDLAGALTRRVG